VRVAAGGEAEGLAVPRLDLAGLWLSDAGFPVGVEVRVEVVEAGRLVVTRVEEGGDEHQGLLPLVWIPAEQLVAVERMAAEAGRRREPVHA
jgi:hypothetical protein